MFSVFGFGKSVLKSVGEFFSGSDYARAPDVKTYGDDSDMMAFNMFDAAYPSPQNVENWGHIKPETAEDITDPQSIERLRTTSFYEVVNDDALNGMVSVGAESIIGTGPMTRVQCGFDYGKETDLEQLIEYLWTEWIEEIGYVQKLRTAQKDLMQYGVYYRRLVSNPRKPFGIDAVLVNPMRVGNPNGIESGDFTTVDGETVRVINGIAYDMFNNERFFCVIDRPAFASGSGTTEIQRRLRLSFHFSRI